MILNAKGRIIEKVITSLALLASSGWIYLASGFTESFTEWITFLFIATVYLFIPSTSLPVVEKKILEENI